MALVTEKTERREHPPDRNEFIEMLQHKIAGETISWKEYERFNIGALPKTLSTLMKLAKAEAYMEATQDKFQLSKGMKITIATIFTIVIIIVIVVVVVQNMGYI